MSTNALICAVAKTWPNWQRKHIDDILNGTRNIAADYSTYVVYITINLNKITISKLNYCINGVLSKNDSKSERKKSKCFWHLRHSFLVALTTIVRYTVPGLPVYRYTGTDTDKIRTSDARTDSEKALILLSTGKRLQKYFSENLFVTKSINCIYFISWDSIIDEVIFVSSSRDRCSALMNCTYKFMNIGVPYRCG